MPTRELAQSMLDSMDRMRFSKKFHFGFLEDDRPRWYQLSSTLGSLTASAIYDWYNHKPKTLQILERLITVFYDIYQDDGMFYDDEGELQANWLGELSGVKAVLSAVQNPESW